MIPQFPAATRQAQIATTFDFMDRLLADTARTPMQAEILALALRRSRAEAGAGADPVLLHLPLAVYECISGDWRPAVPAAAACHLLYMGADLLDNVMDRELAADWAPWGQDQAVLAGCSLLYPLSLLALARLAAPPEVRLALTDTLAEAAWTMAAGQQQDLLLAGQDDVTPEQDLAVAAAKAGAEVAACCRAGALLAGAPADRVTEFTAFGRTIGTASQLVGDCRDIWGGDFSADLANQRRTLPVIYALWSEPPAERPALQALLAAAGAGDRTARLSLRTRLEQGGALLYTALRVEALRRSALAHLQQAGGSHHPLLQTLVNRLNLFDPAVNGAPEPDHPRSEGGFMSDR